MGKEKKKRRGIERTGNEVEVSGRALTEKLTLELRCEGDKGLDHICIWGKEYSWKGVSAKALWQD